MALDPRFKQLSNVRTEHLFDVAIDLQRPLNIGDGPLGRRVFFGAAGGTFEGPRVRGQVLPVGGDWALFRPDGVMVLDVRLTLRTHDDALVQMTYSGRFCPPPELRAAIADVAHRHEIDPARYYFKTNPLFETGAKDYTWMNDIVCVGTGYLIEGGIAYSVARVVQ
ncbi:MAG: DUF3237 domain-containing protein [Burkholderiales bacterium]|nr:DUF3237 domain-containing protein [Burkholderiales bacterium]